MSKKIEAAAATTILKRSLQEARKSLETQGGQREFLETVLLGTHKTYRYVLLTAILAKATSEDIDILALQAKGKGDGAYDARSLCHNVVVPFEREYLNSALGGSNEPYLNKPARFQRLSIKNAVRSGNDREILQLMCDTLPGLNKKNAYLNLVDSLRILIKEGARLKEELARTIIEDQELYNLRRFILQFSAVSHEGETLAASVGACLRMIYKESLFTVEVHNVNQSGASSKEVADIDVYSGNIIFLGIELKDKAYRKQDVQHAISKAIKANLMRLMFVEGVNGKLVNSSWAEEISLADEHKFHLQFIRIEDLVSTLLSLSVKPTSQEIYSHMKNIIHLCKFKKQTSEHLESLIKTYGWAE